MKTVRRAARILGVTWIALAITASGISGMVLCIGADGHISFEWAHQGSCQNSTDPSEHASHFDSEVLPAADAECCGACVDVSLSSEGVAKARKETRRHRFFEATLIAPAPGAGVAFRDSVAPGDNASPSPCARSGLSPTLLAHRTVVLRT